MGAWKSWSWILVPQVQERRGEEWFSDPMRDGLGPPPPTEPFTSHTSSSRPTCQPGLQSVWSLLSRGKGLVAGSPVAALPGGPAG